MQLKRTIDPVTGQYVLAVCHQQAWVSLADVLADIPHLRPNDWAPYSAGLIRFLGQWPLVAQVAAYLQQATKAFRGLLPGRAPVLPFAPASYRDFMLSEQHYLDAGWGYLRRFRPQLARFVRAYERVLGTFPALKPKSLWYQEPIYYLGNHLNFVTDGALVACPPYSQALDYELELGFFIVQPLKDASPTEALAAIGGFVVLNDFSARCANSRNEQWLWAAKGQAFYQCHVGSGDYCRGYSPGHKSFAGGSIRRWAADCAHLDGAPEIYVGRSFGPRVEGRATTPGRVFWDGHLAGRQRYGA